MGCAGPRPTRAACHAVVAATAVKSTLREATLTAATLTAARSIVEVRYARSRTA
jgi:hypothetical protein